MTREYIAFLVTKPLVTAFAAVAFGGNNTNYDRRYWGPGLTFVILLADMYWLTFLPYQRTFFNYFCMALCANALPISMAATVAAYLDDRNSEIPTTFLYFGSTAVLMASVVYLYQKATELHTVGLLEPKAHILANALASVVDRRAGDTLKPMHRFILVEGGEEVASKGSNGKKVVFRLLERLSPRTTTHAFSQSPLAHKFKGTEFKNIPMVDTFTHEGTVTFVQFREFDTDKHPWPWSTASESEAQRRLKTQAAKGLWKSAQWAWLRNRLNTEPARVGGLANDCMRKLAILYVVDQENVANHKGGERYTRILEEITHNLLKRDGELACELSFPTLLIHVAKGNGEVEDGQILRDQLLETFQSLPSPGCSFSPRRKDDRKNQSKQSNYAISGQNKVEYPWMHVWGFNDSTFKGLYEGLDSFCRYLSGARTGLYSSSVLAS